MKRVLSISGGGVKGIQPAIYLEALEHITGRPTRDLFDLVIGTSTGGLIAAAVTAPLPKSGVQLVDLYEDRAKDIFAKPWYRPLATGFGLLSTKYDGVGLYKVVQEVLGDGPLAGHSKPTVLTAYNLRTRSAEFFKSHGPSGIVPAAVAACATAAAPTYFPAVRGRVDGAIAGVNDPSMAGTIEAMDLFKVPAYKVAVLALGCGGSKVPIRDRVEGYANVGDIVSCLLDGSQDTTAYMVERVGLGAYLRLNAPPEMDTGAGMDDASPANIAQLSNVARKVVMKNTQNLLAWLKAAELEK